MRVEYSKIKVFFSSAAEMWAGQIRLIPIVGITSPLVLPACDVHHHEHISDTQVLTLVIPDWCVLWFLYCLFPFLEVEQTNSHSTFLVSTENQRMWKIMCDLLPLCSCNLYIFLFALLPAKLLHLHLPSLYHFVAVNINVPYGWMNKGLSYFVPNKWIMKMTLEPSFLAR